MSSQVDSNFEGWVVKLIRSVESKPPLYNNAFREHSDRHTVARCWTEVCRDVIPEWKSLSAEEKEVKEKEIQQKWRNLRTSFRREIRTQNKIKCSKTGHKRRKYIHFDEMLFLLPYYTSNNEEFNETNVAEDETQDESSFEDSTVKFIKIVESKPALYNKNLKEYSDRHTVARLWFEVCAELVPEWESLSAAEKALKAKETLFKWRNLRTSFKRELKVQTKAKYGQVSYKRRKYMFFDQLLFLLPFVEDKEATNSESNACEMDIVQEDDQDDSENEAPTTNKRKAPTTSKNEEDIVQEDEQEDFEYEAQTLNEIEAPTASKKKAPPISKNEGKRSVKEASFEEHIVQEDEQESFGYEAPTTSINKIKQSANSASFEEILLDFPKEIDEDKSFLISLVPSFKRMSQSQKIDAKIGILSVIKQVTQNTSKSSYNYKHENFSNNSTLARYDIADDDASPQSSSNDVY
ncbi:PREDICTED: uncharacterized protein LOC108367371 isoform X2 [Rhagoletis zephyria]|uniref:uncharacterized protein LOC108367371 isoform X2 n=1 Tax=Rhagoletis zephyria TaxID=28612 RepID=UPI0008118800|nr:PREDICTED: uncharacterized protein LOC108367371 isoform X2 [Rhagoletis zephyria]